MFEIQSIIVVRSNINYQKNENIKSCSLVLTADSLRKEYWITFVFKKNVLSILNWRITSINIISISQLSKFRPIMIGNVTATLILTVQVKWFH